MIIQGDSAEVLKSLPSDSVDLICTDPPYGMSYQSSRRIDKHRKIIGDDDLSWLPTIARELYRVLKPDRHAYLFCNEYAISLFRSELENAGFRVKRCLVWLKNNHSSGDLEGDYGNMTEFIVFAHKGRRPLIGKRDTNVVRFPRTNNDLHPTQKPVELIEYLISKSSLPGEKVLDPFLGSGTTAVAAVKLGRRYIGIEIDADYVAKAQARLSSIPAPLFQNAAE